jgi:hypothetical protein
MLLDMFVVTQVTRRSQAIGTRQCKRECSFNHGLSVSAYMSDVAVATARD